MRILPCGGHFLICQIVCAPAMKKGGRTMRILINTSRLSDKKKMPVADVGKRPSVLLDEVKVTYD